MEVVQHERRVQRVRHELHRRDVQVVRTESAGPGYVRITFTGETLGGFTSAGFDDHVKFMFTDPTGELVSRDYTPCRFDHERGEVTIEFAIHGHGLASEWSRHASVGDRAVIAGPRGSMIIPTDYRWHLLAGDATALPAIDRRLAELPGDAKAIVVVQLADAADRRHLASEARFELQWVSTPDELVATVRALRLPPGDGYAWCAGEASTMARLREILVVEKAHPREAMRVAAYWKRGASSFHEELAD